MSSSLRPLEKLLPTGTVTFLFTDIEGSAMLAQNHPEEMSYLLAKHHAILRQSIEDHHGHVFHITGDAFSSAFHTCGEAVNAAIEAQRKLLHEAWQPTPVKVRMGIHTGTAIAGALEDSAGGYNGYLTLTRVQRVMSAAHGGQVLLSSASAELVRGQLPDGVELRDMGEHRLKGLVNPEHLWQVVAPGLVYEFPPILSFNTIPNNLPAQPTALIGREAELNEIVNRLNSEEVRLLTLTGPGGIGKTRMALQAAAEQIDRFKDGVYFVDLAPIRDGEAVPAAIAHTLGFRETSDRSLLDDLKGQLRGKRMLLLLDNFEQVMAAATKVVELLRDCPKLMLLVTSREALHVRDEYVFLVPPLALPKADLKQLPVEQLTQYEAVRLFIERARAVKPDFKITNENAPAVAEICWRLDGLPLSIELAAARIRLFPPQALLEHLGSRLKLLRGGARDLPARQQTLRDAIDWSYELLDDGEKRLFELLSVFTGGGSFTAVESVASGIEPLDETDLDIFDGLSSLVEKSLIRQADQDGGESRLLMLETIREFASERLEEDPTYHAAVHRAHATYFASFAQRQWKHLTDRGKEEALEALSSDIENVRTAWDYWVGERDLEQLSKFVDSLWLLYDVRGWYHASVNLTNDLLDVLSSTPSTPERIQQEIMLQTSLARALLAIKGYTAEVEKAYTRALGLSEMAGEIPQIFPVLRGLSSLYLYLGEFEKGVQIGEKIMELAERQDDADMRVEAHLVLGTNLSFHKNLNLGLEHLEKAITSFNPDRHRMSRFKLGANPGVVGYTASALLLWMLGFPDRALQRANEAIDLAKRLNHPYSMAYASFHSGFLHLWRREARLAKDRADAALEIAEEHEFQVWRAVAICLNGAALASMGQAEQGLTRIHKGIALYQGLKTPPIFWPLVLFLQAMAEGQAGNPERGAARLDEAMEIGSHSSGRALIPEFLRLKGDLLLAMNPNNASEAESLYQGAVEIAREMETRMMELRAAIRLYRLWQDQGKEEQGSQLLRAAYGGFTEGFETVDLMEAKEFLGQ
ncbi:MAG: adenylate/guanylate cyclase domain-containing protein [Omnitrophica WOR_2 bacterium]